jgi:hypothetical protein
MLDLVFLVYASQSKENREKVKKCDDFRALLAVLFGSAHVVVSLWNDCDDIAQDASTLHDTIPGVLMTLPDVASFLKVQKIKTNAGITVLQFIYMFAVMGAFYAPVAKYFSKGYEEYN